MRLIENGGGPGGTDIITSRSGANNCQEHCNWLATTGYFEGGATSTSLAYFSRCYEAVTPYPLNGYRIAFPSQIGTPDIDPALPQNFWVGNANVSCTSMIVDFHLLVYVYSKVNFLFN